MRHINKEFLILHLTKILAALPEYKYLAQSSKLVLTSFVIKALNIQTATLVVVVNVNKLVFLPGPH
jgi:hypothetical protein